MKFNQTHYTWSNRLYDQSKHGWGIQSSSVADSNFLTKAESFSKQIRPENFNDAGEIFKYAEDFESFVRAGAHYYASADNDRDIYICHLLVPQNPVCEQADQLLFEYRFQNRKSEEHELEILENGTSFDYKTALMDTGLAVRSKEGLPVATERMANLVEAYFRIQAYENETNLKVTVSEQGDCIKQIHAITYVLLSMAGSRKDYLKKIGYSFKASISEIAFIFVPDEIQEKLISVPERINSEEDIRKTVFSYLAQLAVTDCNEFRRAFEALMEVKANAESTEQTFVLLKYILNNPECFKTDQRDILNFTSREADARDNVWGQVYRGLSAAIKYSDGDFELKTLFEDINGNRWNAQEISACGLERILLKRYQAMEQFSYNDWIYHIALLRFLRRFHPEIAENILDKLNQESKLGTMIRMNLEKTADNEKEKDNSLSGNYKYYNVLFTECYSDYLNLLVLTDDHGMGVLEILKRLYLDMKSRQNISIQQLEEISNWVRLISDDIEEEFFGNWNLFLQNVWPVLKKSDIDRNAEYILIHRVLTGWKNNGAVLTDARIDIEKARSIFERDQDLKFFTDKEKSILRQELSAADKELTEEMKKRDRNIFINAAWSDLFNPDLIEKSIEKVINHEISEQEIKEFWADAFWRIYGNVSDPVNFCQHVLFLYKKLLVNNNISRSKIRVIDTISSCMGDLEKKVEQYAADEKMIPSKQVIEMYCEYFSMVDDLDRKRFDTDDPQEYFWDQLIHGDRIENSCMYFKNLYELVFDDNNGKIPDKYRKLFDYDGSENYPDAEDAYWFFIWYHMRKSEIIRNYDILDPESSGRNIDDYEPDEMYQEYERFSEVYRTDKNSKYRKQAKSHIWRNLAGKLDEASEIRESLRTCFHRGKDYLCMLTADCDNITVRTEFDSQEQLRKAMQWLTDLNWLKQDFNNKCMYLNPEKSDKSEIRLLLESYQKCLLEGMLTVKNSEHKESYHNSVPDGKMTAKSSETLTEKDLMSLWNNNDDDLG